MATFAAQKFCSMHKVLYTAPEAELMEILTYDNFLISIGSASDALGNSSTEEGSDYDDGNPIGW